jgi:hypothetical protein
LRESGKSTLDFKMTQEFMNKFNQKEKKIVFKTHKELDIFVNGLLDIDPDFKNNYKDVWNFLKSFDRGLIIILKKHFG